MAHNQNIVNHSEPFSGWYVPEQSSSGSYFDTDYPLTPAYDETGAIFFDSGASGANDGTSWVNAYTDEETALNALCAASAGTMLTCRGTFDTGTGIELSGDGGLGDINNWYVFRADPVQGCNITGSNIKGIEFGGQGYWIIDGFNITGGGRIFSYFPGGSSSGAVTHMVHRNITGTMGLGGDNVGWVHYDTGGADYIGVFDSVVVGPGIGVNANTAVIYLSRVGHWKVRNCVMSNAPKGFFFKHFDAGSYYGLGHQEFIDNYVYGCSNITTASNGALFRNNIIDTVFYLLDDSGGDNGCDDNIIDHNTITEKLELSERDNLAQGNTVTNNIIEGQYLNLPWQSDTAGTNISDYNLYGSNIVYRSSAYTLPQWQGASVPSGQDSNSISGTPTYVGGATPNAVSGYELTPVSAGVGAASGNANIGADVSTVGVNT